MAEAQRDAMRRAFKLAERNPREVDFIELHATGQFPRRALIPVPIKSMDI